MTVDELLMLSLILLFTSLGNSYYDIMHHNKKPFYLRGSEEDSNIMDAYLMHSVCTLPFLFLMGIFTIITPVAHR